MTGIVILVGIICIIAVMRWHSKLENAQSVEVTNTFFTKVYKEDIDWSLMVKGYPVVNDMDIRYTEWLARS